MFINVIDIISVLNVDGRFPFIYKPCFVTELKKIDIFLFLSSPQTKNVSCQFTF